VYAEEHSLEAFVADARVWLEANPPRSELDLSVDRGPDSFDVAVFDDLTYEEEKARLVATSEWQQRKFDAGYAMLSWPVEQGGRGLPVSFVRAFSALEAEYSIPTAGELPPTSTALIAPTIAEWGTPGQRERFVRPLMRMEEFACQLFSEPSAGSDLASVTTRAERSGDKWILNGQKVWTSGARHATWGLAITRHDFDAPKHRGLTAFLVPLNAPGVDIRPIRQMSGGFSFNDVFLTDVQVADELRIGDAGDGWRVALTCLGFERSRADNDLEDIGGGFEQALRTARHLGRTTDPIVRQILADLYVHFQVARRMNEHAAARLQAGETPPAADSLGKLMWTQNMTRVSDVMSVVLGPALIADNGTPATYEWTKHVLGAPGYRIAGGSDEIQRDIIGQRVLGLPAEPRVDKDVPFRELMRSQARSVQNALEKQ